MGAAAGANHLAAQLGSRLGRGPADEQGRPAVTVFLGLVGGTPVRGLLVRRAVVHKLDAGGAGNGLDRQGNQARSTLGRKPGIHHVMQRTARRIAHGGSVAVHGQELERGAWLRRRLRRAQGSGRLLEARRGCSRSTAWFPGRDGLGPAMLGVLTGLPWPALPGLVPGTDAEVQRASEIGVPVGHSRREERSTTEGSEQDQSADELRRCGSRAGVARLVPVPAVAVPGVLTLHSTPFTAFPCRADPPRNQALGKQGTNTNMRRANMYKANKRAADRRAANKRAAQLASRLTLQFRGPGPETR